MPVFTAPDGSTQYIPGVYSDFRVRSSVAGPLPIWHVPVVIGHAEEGPPFNFDAIKSAAEDELGPFRQLRDASQVAATYGEQSEIHRIATFAKRHGLGTAFYAAGNQLTRAQVIITSTGPNNEVLLIARKAGWPSNWIKIDDSAGGKVFTYTPLKYKTRILADVGSSDVRLVVQDNSWIRVGMTLNIGSNATSATTKTVVSKGSVRTATGIERFVIVNSAPGAVTVANYAAIWEYDEQNKITVTPGAATTAGFIQATNEHPTCPFYAVADDDESGAAFLTITSPPKALIAITDWDTVTKGTSPAFTATDSAAFVALMNAGGWEAFLSEYQRIPRIYYVGSALMAVHEDWRDYALSERARGFPVMVVTGADTGDLDLTGDDSGDLTYRAESIDNQDVALCATGIDDEAAYISFGAAVFGRIVEGGVGHNLTNDPLIYSVIEKKWSRTQLETLHRKGVIVPRMATHSPFRFVISQGVSTLQDNELLWNPTTKATWSLHQRDLADFNSRALGDDISRKELGSDAVTPNSVAQTLLARVFQLERAGTIQAGSHVIDLIEEDGNGGMNVEQGFRLPGLSDYFGITNTLIVGA